MTTNPIKGLSWQEYMALLEQGLPCDVCGQNANELHHAIVYRDKNCPEVNHWINGSPRCREHHIHSYQDKRKHLNRQVERFGFEEVLKFFEQLPAKKRNREVRGMMALVNLERIER